MPLVLKVTDSDKSITELRKYVSLFSILNLSSSKMVENVRQV
jgi:hypothetical protein